MTKPAKQKFRIGQVVWFSFKKFDGTYSQGYGAIDKIFGKHQHGFSINGFHYMPEELRPLTARERGNK